MTHYVYGSGSHGCLYDYGPCYSSDLPGAVIDLCAVFSHLADETLADMRAALRTDHYFRFPDSAEAGSEYCEIVACNCGRPGDHQD